MARTHVLLASNNAHKLAEFRDLLADTPVILETPQDHQIVVDVEENGSTFEENARLKAREFAVRGKMIALADDSGLEIPSLGNWPGVLSSRWAGPNADDALKRQLLLERLAEHTGRDRKARFVCVISVACPEGIIGEERGTLEGEITTTPRGTGGFGYDPIFRPTGYDRTLAEMSPAEKNRLSHRARAIAQIKPLLHSLRGGG